MNGNPTNYVPNTSTVQVLDIQDMLDEHDQNDEDWTNIEGVEERRKEMEKVPDLRLIDVEITTFRKESIHIHFLRLLGLCLHPEVNRRICKAMSNIHVTNQVDVEVRETSIKSDTTIRNRTKT